MAEQFLHGIEIVELDNGIRPITTVRSSVIHVFGTAPDADAAVFPIGQPVLLLSEPRKATLLGNSGTLKDAVESIYKQDAAAVIVTRVEEGEDLFDTWSNILGSVVEKTGVWTALTARAKVGIAPKLLCAPGFTGQRIDEAVTQVVPGAAGTGYGTTPPTVVIYPADATKTVAAPVAASGNAGDGVLTLANPTYGSNFFPGSYEVEMTSPTAFSVKDPLGGVVGTGEVGTPYDGMGIHFSIAAGDDAFVAGDKWTLAATVTGGAGVGAEATATLLLGAVSGYEVTRSGWGYTAGATVATASAVGSGATATTNVGDAANPVVAELLGVADRLRAIIVADGPNSTDEAAVEYRGDFGSKRVYIVDPHVLVYDTDLDSPIAKPGSAAVCGVISRMDREKGFWWSPSNQIINGVIGTARPIDFNISDRNSQANYLNENEVATVIRHDGFRLWGNRTTATDPLWAFLAVRRTADMVYESIEQAFLWAIDRPLTAQNILEIPESVNAYLRHLKAVGAILGGNAWIDPEVNTPAQLQAGKLTVSFDIEPPAPLEHLIFHAYRNGSYYEEVIERVVRELTQ